MKRNFTPLDNIAMCAAITLTVTFYGFESYVPAKIMGIMQTAALVIMFFCWGYASLISGRKNHCSFAAFTSLYWTVPTVFSYLTEDMLSSVKTFDGMIYGISESCKLLSIYPLSVMTEATNSYLLSAVLFSVLCELLYFSGVYVSRKKAEKQLT